MLLAEYLNGSPVFDDNVLVMLFFQVGEVFEHLAPDNGKKSIAKLTDIRPDSATVERDGQLLPSPRRG